MCKYINGVETTIYFFLRCANFNLQRQTLFDNISNVVKTILSENDDSIVNTFLLGKQNNDNSVNKAILNLKIEYILSSKRFNCPLF